MKRVTLRSLADNIDKLAIATAKGFRDVDDRFKRVDERFDRIEATIQHGFNEIGGRVTSLERRALVLEDKK